MIKSGLTVLVLYARRGELEVRTAERKLTLQSFHHDHASSNIGDFISDIVVVSTVSVRILRADAFQWLHSHIVRRSLPAYVLYG